VIRRLTLLIMSCCFCSMSAQDIQYVGLNLSQRPQGDGCSIVLTKDAMIKTLSNLGYTAVDLPKIDFANNAAVVITLVDDSLEPDSYSASGKTDASTGVLTAVRRINVVLGLASVIPHKYLYVMTILKADSQASVCTVEDPFAISGGRAMTSGTVATGATGNIDHANPDWLKATRNTPATVVVPGGSSSTSGIVIQKGGLQ
jgi:hypothetical protein